ncbi:MAG: DUF2933 domain-containing protein [Dehalococcoidia bacterium]
MAAYLPIVICLLACPVIMLVMMKGMGGKDEADDQKSRGAVKPNGADRGREEQAAELKAQLADIQGKRETLEQDLHQAEHGARQTEPSKESVA